MGACVYAGPDLGILQHQWHDGVLTEMPDRWLWLLRVITRQRVAQMNPFLIAHNNSTRIMTVPNRRLTIHPSHGSEYGKPLQRERPLGYLETIRDSP